MHLHWIDHAVVMYLIGISASVYGVVLFVANWIRMGHASSVYKYVTLLLLGQVVAYSMALTSRVQFLHGNTDLLRSTCWGYRNYLSVFAIVCLVVAMTRRWLLPKNIASQDRRCAVNEHGNEEKKD